MPSTILQHRSTFVLLAALILSAVTAHAQPAQRLPKLDASLSASVRAGQSDTKQVIIRATSGGIPAVTKALSANGEALRVFSTINALLAKVPVAALEGLSRNPFVESISSDAVVVATQTSTTDSTLRGRSACPSNRLLALASELRSSIPASRLVQNSAAASSPSTTLRKVEIRRRPLMSTGTVLTSPD
jgi:hypothetical protein